MQSVAVYGRLLARALVSGFNNDFAQLSIKNSAETQTTNPLRLVTASSGLGKNQSNTRRKWSFGDDACFIASHKFADVIGVADGVGGWRNYGVDPSIFPICLMDTCSRLVKMGRFQANRMVDMLSNSYEEILLQKQPLVGSCTACVIALASDESVLYTANLGDSGFLVIRDGNVLHRSVEQQHYFNAPYQLAIAPDSLEGRIHSDSPQSANSDCINVEEGDLIIVGTDGLFDNMNDEFLLSSISGLQVILGELPRSSADHCYSSLQNVANEIARQANSLAHDKEHKSPFSLAAAKNGYQFKGGKPDDITVLLSHVTRKVNS